MNKESKIIILIFIFSWVAISIKLFSISSKSGSYYQELASKNTLSTQYLPNMRGIIYDRNGIALAINEVGFSIALKPHLKQKNLKKIIKKIKIYFDFVDEKKLIKIYNKRDSLYMHKAVSLINFIKYEDIISIYPRLHTDENIIIKPSVKRRYPYGKITAHVLGYVVKNHKAIDKVSRYTSIIPKRGVELYYNKHLQGELNHIKYRINALNEKVEELSRFVSTKNTDIHLSLDVKLQKFIYDLFEQENKAKIGAMLVSKTKTGEILSAVSYPSFDPSIFTNGISQKNWNKILFDVNKPFVNKFSKGAYPSASTIKMATELAFLSNGLSSRKQYFCTGNYRFGGRNFRCWNSGGHGRVNANRAIRESCDDYFYKGIHKIGINKVASTMRDFGFGRKTGLDLYDEHTGIVPDKAWKLRVMKRSWFIGESFISAIGQGNNLATPIQVHNYTSTLANGFTNIPHFIKKMGDKKVTFSSTPLDPKYDKYLKNIRKSMFQVCNHPKGTGYKYTQGSILSLACKTGTAQVISIPQNIKKRLKEHELKRFKRSHAWFTLYFPVKKPRYTITILLEHGGHGSAGAEIAVKVANYLVRRKI